MVIKIAHELLCREILNNMRCDFLETPSEEELFRYRDIP